MGRILNTLTQNAHRGAASAASPNPLKGGPEPTATCAGDAADEVPFIEVGGRGTAVEGSAAVLAAMPAATHALAPAAPPAPGFEAPRFAKPWTVAYQPVPALGRRALTPPRLSPSLIASHHPDHAASVQYRSLLAGITGQFPGCDARVLLLTAPTSGTGTTTVLLNLAITRTRQTGKPVVVVDANLRRPAVAERLGLPPGPGLCDVAAHRLPLSAALQETGQPGLVALTAGETARSAGTWPHTEALRAVVQQLRNPFDWVLIDGPSWDGGPEMVALGSACDAIYLVLRPAEVDSPVVNDLGRLIPHLGSCLGGFILTQQ